MIDKTVYLTDLKMDSGLPIAFLTLVQKDDQFTIQKEVLILSL